MKIYLCFVIVTVFSFNQSIYATDLDKLKQNLKDFYLLEKSNNTEIESLLKSISKEFSFPDIDYNSHRRSNWTPKQHLTRLLILATAFEDVDSKYYKSDKLSTTIVGALNFWSYNNFYSDNWWQTEIGVPQNIGPTLILCESIIPDSTMTKSLNVMDESRIYKTGQNKTWLSGNVFMRELLRTNDTLIYTAANTIKSVLVPSAPYQEGIQPDYSFHQHGPQPQFGNYGLHFVEDTIKWMFIFNDTEIAFSPQQVDLMRNLIFEGQQKVVYKGNYEILATGRQIFPEFVNGEKYRGPKSKGELYQSLEKKFNLLDTHQNPEHAPSEYVHFRNSDYSLYRTANFFSAVRMSSQRVIGAEAGNGENQSGYYLGDGTHLIYRTGNEYQGIYPVWNWKKLPGTTIVQDTVKLPILTWDGYKNNSYFSGGLKSKNISITAFKYRRDSLKANKSYFFENNKIYALGSGISTNRNFKVVTTVNQSLKHGDVIVNKANDLITSVWHDSIAYINLNKQHFNVKHETQTGNWKKILTWHTDSLISKDVFNLEVNHGKHPKDEKYAYVSVVGISDSQVKNVIKEELGTIIAHTNKAHAISFNHGKNISISAFEPCEIEIGSKQKLVIKSPCLLSLIKQENGWLIEAVDPTQQLAKLSFEISGKYVVQNQPQSEIHKNVTVFDIITPKSNNEKGSKNTVILEGK